MKIADTIASIIPQTQETEGSGVLPPPVSASLVTASALKIGTTGASSIDQTVTIDAKMLTAELAETRPVAFHHTALVEPSTEPTASLTDFHGIDNLVQIPAGAKTGEKVRLYALESNAEHVAPYLIKQTVGIYGLASVKGKGSTNELMSHRLAQKVGPEATATTAVSLQVQGPELEVTPWTEKVWKVGEKVSYKGLAYKCKVETKAEAGYEPTGGAHSAECWEVYSPITNAYGLYVPGPPGSSTAYSTLPGVGTYYAINVPYGASLFSDSMKITQVAGREAVALTIDNSAAGGGAKSGLLVIQRAAAIGLKVEQLGAALGLNVIQSGATYGAKIEQLEGGKGFYALNVSGYDYGAEISTLASQAGGRTCRIARNGTAGIGLEVLNKGSGISFRTLNTAEEALFQVNAAGGFGAFKVTPPAAQHAEVASPAAELTALKTAVDALREVVKEYGMTA